MKKRTRGRIRAFEEGRTEPIEKKKKKRIKINRMRLFFTVIVVILIAAVCVSVKNVFELRAEQAELKANNKILEAQLDDLKDELKHVNNKDYIEEQARIQLKLIKPGEVLYILDDDKENKNGEKNN